MDKPEAAALVQVLAQRFAQHPGRHPGVGWPSVLTRLEARPDKLGALAEMERSGGEPDVIGQDQRTGEVTFCDCSPESPAGRRSLCYDRRALEGRKANKPSGAALEVAQAMGIELLTEAEYRELQGKGEFDRKTSSWVRTPEAVRDLGGALFCDRRYGQVFVYHNGADSYYGSRGFRGRCNV